MRGFIVRENIERFRKRLETEADPAERRMLQQLLAEEEAKLKALERPAISRPIGAAGQPDETGMSRASRERHA